MKNYIVVEREFDKKLLELLLPDEVIQNTKIIIGSGYMSSISLAKSLYSRGDNKIIIAIDSDSVNEIDVLEKNNFIKNLFSIIPSNSQYKVVLFQPEIEKLFFNDKAFIDSFFQNKISENDLVSAKRDPKFYLLRLSEGKENIKTIRNKLLNKLTPENKQMIRNSNEVKEILHFIQN